MPRMTLASLAPMVRDKRSGRGLRETSKEIGIGPATLMRVEAGRIPDVETFGKICKWLGVDPASFLGLDTVFGRRPEVEKGTEAILVSAHLRADAIPEPATVQALARMIAYVAARQRPTLKVPEDADA